MTGKELHHLWVQDGLCFARDETYLWEKLPDWQKDRWNCLAIKLMVVPETVTLNPYDFKGTKWTSK